MISLTLRVWCVCVYFVFLGEGVFVFVCVWGGVLIHFKHTEFGGECVVSCYHSVIFRSYVLEYLEKIIISYTECVRVCVLNFQIL